MRRRLIVNWRGEESSSIIPVAELIVIEEPGKKPRYEFGYLAGVEHAIQLGFPPFLAFPDLGRRYASAELFPFFQNRVLPTTRPDYADYVEALGLARESAAFADLLGRSNARRATDRIETVLVPERSPAGLYTTHFLVRGINYAATSEAVAARLSRGDRLSLVLDANNAVNPRARGLASQGEKLGFLPDYLVADIDALEVAGAAATVTVERTNPPPLPAHHRVLCRLEAPWPEGFLPFRDPRLVPYEVDAVARAG